MHFRNEGLRIKILFLTFAHPELYRIEMLWSKLNPQVASRKMNIRMSIVEELTREAVAKFNAGEFENM